ncbi:MAG: 4a-hydroxytetrahydrobiopterin dehydratase [Porticoccaceae bacterium]|nr:4a-hydroxytetrahydrobiopterin dehydratase [Porticoccaceae bacterium]
MSADNSDSNAKPKQPNVEIALLPEHDLPLNLEQRDILLAELSHWKLLERNKVELLQRVFIFETYSEALNFTYRLGEVSQQAGRYPTLITALQKVTVMWHTPDAGLLTANDIVLAKNTDKLFV